MVSKAIITTTDVRSDISITDVQSVLAVTLLAAEVVLDPDPKNKWFYDQFSFADLPAFGFGKNPADTLTLSDAISQIGFATAKSDAVTVTESINILLEIFRAFSDPFTLGDAFANAVSTAPSNQYGLNEANAKGVGLSKSDTYGFNDVDAFAFSKGLADQYGFNDVYAYTFRKGLADQHGFTEANAKGVGLSKSDIYGFNDVDAFAFSKGLADSHAMSDVFSREIIYARNFSDAFPLDDSATASNAKTSLFAFSDDQAFGFGKSSSDSLSLSEAIDSFVLGKEATDTVSVTENFSFALFSSATLNSATLNSATLN